jgi:hypothetical protein
LIDKTGHGAAAKVLDDLAQQSPVPAKVFFTSASMYRVCVIDALKEKNHKAAELYAARIVNLLERAWEGGYFSDRQTVMEIKNFATLEILQSRPDFQALLKKIRTIGGGGNRQVRNAHLAA